jgi:hypothetical protein
VNGIPTGSGGTHENGLRAGLGKAVRNFIDTHNLPKEIYDNCELEELAPSGFFQKVMPRSFDAPGHEADAIWEAIVPSMRFRDGKLEALTVYPVDLSRALPPTQRGTAGLASGEVAERILARQQRLSAAFGTTLNVRSGIAEVPLS